MTPNPPSGPSAGPAATYPGARLGLPAEGPGSIAGWGRRLLALVIDWVASMLVAALFVGTAVWTGQGPEQWATMTVFLVEATLLTAVAGGSFGQIATRIAVVRMDSTQVNVLVALLRTLLVCLVVPPLVFNRDQRGLHDLAAKTVTLKR